MLYPKININKKEPKNKNKVDNTKKVNPSTIKKFSNYSAFILFLTQKLHF